VPGGRRGQPLGQRCALPHAAADSDVRRGHAGVARRRLAVSVASFSWQPAQHRTTASRTHARSGHARRGRRVIRAQQRSSAHATHPALPWTRAHRAAPRKLARSCIGRQAYRQRRQTAADGRQGRHGRARTLTLTCCARWRSAAHRRWRATSASCVSATSASCVSAAHLKAFQQGQAERLFTEPHVCTMQRGRGGGAFRTHGATV
jgi:hypothetical protein